MTAPAKQSSRWGSFFQQALDGVESRLDNILVGDGPSDVAAGAATVGNTASIKPENGSTRNSSNTTVSNDRLQERLAKAIAAKKYAAQKSDNHASSSGVPSRVGSPVTGTETPRHSSDNMSVGSEDTAGEQKQNKNSSDKIPIQDAETRTIKLLSGESIKDSVNGLSPKINTEESPRPSMESLQSSTSKLNNEPSRDPVGTASLTHEDESASEGPPTMKSLYSTTESNPPARQQQNDQEISDLQRQEEMHDYIERIDALQAKLRYLSRESAESARKAAASAAPNSIEKKLAEKDEQIALLMEEGQILSKNELKHMTVIKKLRTKATEAEKETAEAKRRLEKADKEKSHLSERLKRAETTEKLSTEKQRVLIQTQKDIEAIIADRDAKGSMIAELRAQLLDASAQVNANEVKAIQELLATEKRRVVELENDVSSIKIEKELATGRAKSQIEEIRTKYEREAERARITEVEMKAEQQMLESRLEVMRTRAEEVSSGSAGDAQAKLLRQIETLQTQYAIASENWQGIEASLTGRATNLEKERDGALRRESDTRRKAREVTLKSKRNEEELEDLRNKLASLELELTEQKQQLEKAQWHAKDCQSALIESKNALEHERQAWKSDAQQRMDEERPKWREDSIAQSPFGLGGAESPVPSSHRNLTADLLGLQNLQTRNAARSFTSELPAIDTRASRKSSAQHVRSSDRATPQRQDSTQFLVYGEVLEQPLPHGTDTEGCFEHMLSPSPTHHTMHDMLSVSTVGAGPSVQLVERMSAAVRRLESEKVSTKEELKRLSTQRDEARAQIVTLMQEIETRRALDTRLHELEEENNKINARYQTTLEMLGEKSELVEELRADVQDVKDMYRELVERTVK